MTNRMANESLVQRRVLVTGGAAGIGRATVLRFAAEGARVAAWDMNEEGGAALLAEAKSRAAADVRFSRVDVTDKAAVSAGVAEMVARWGGIDVLVNNAGITRDAQMVKVKDGAVVSTMSEEAFDSVVSVNLRSVFLCTREVVPHMISGGGGVILNAASVVGLYGNFGQTNYAATKAGVISFTRTWARELGRFHIRVNAVAPGFIATEMVTAMPEKVISTMETHTPLGRLGRPEDIANAYAWLASEQASFIHGAVLSVDGGLVLGT
jgi:3-oxoacyl-[acyl-carrier protein] reductase